MKKANQWYFIQVTILALDPSNDLALAKIEEPEDQRTPPLTLFDGDDIPPGTKAIAIGSPLGLEFSLTSGITSGTRVQQGTTFLQIQTAIGPGSSGGPLLDDRAALIGVNTATRGAGLNLSVHVKHVRALLDEAREPKALDPWVVGTELVGLDSTTPLLPTTRGTIEALANMLARVVDGCATQLPEGSVDVQVQLGEELTKFEASSNLVPDENTCLQERLEPSLFFVGATLRQLGEPPDELRMRFTGVQGQSPEQRSDLLITLRGPKGEDTKSPEK